MGKLYVLESNGLYKIGVTCQPMKKRLSDLQTGNPFDIKVQFVKRCANYLYMETYFHELFLDKRLRGEWFILDNNDLAIVANCRKYSVLR